MNNIAQAQANPELATTKKESENFWQTSLLVDNDNEKKSILHDSYVDREELDRSGVTLAETKAETADEGEW